MTQVQPPSWSDDQFEWDRAKAVTTFRELRMQEPLEQYLDAFDGYRTAVENLIESTVDLSQLSDRALDVLTDPHLLVAVRYLASPAVSVDDLKVLAEATLSPSGLRNDEAMARRVIETVLLGLDRNRFPWVAEDREATVAERETATVATAALIAARRVMTDRANTSKTAQENSAADLLVAEGFTEVDRRTVNNLSQAPKAGEFCRECKFGARKADLIAGLWDGRVMPLECKVSNSSTNSIKRLNGDAALKARVWLDTFGPANIIPSAVLSGVFKLRNLRMAQDDGLTIWWAHNLAALAEFITLTKTP
jgi:hypothetical protein